MRAPPPPPPPPGMHGALRNLRTSSSAGGDHEAALLILRDTEATAASWTIFQHVRLIRRCSADRVCERTSSADHGTMQCAQVLRESATSPTLQPTLPRSVVIAVDPDSSALSGGVRPHVDTLEAHSDSWGWDSSGSRPQQHSTVAAQAAQQRPVCWDTFASMVEQDLQKRAALIMAQLHAATGAEVQQPRLCLVVNSLSTLATYYSVAMVISALLLPECSVARRLPH